LEDGEIDAIEADFKQAIRMDCLKEIELLTRDFAKEAEPAKQAARAPKLARAVADLERVRVALSLYASEAATLEEFFLRSLRNVPQAKPWVALEEEGRTLVSIPATAADHLWQTIDSTDVSEAYVSALADESITADGKEGEIIRLLEAGSYPILIAHWQSLMSNGLGTGVRALGEIASRIQLHLADRVEWMSFEEILHLVLADKKAYPKPHF